MLYVWGTLFLNIFFVNLPKRCSWKYHDRSRTFPKTNYVNFLNICLGNIVEQVIPNEFLHNDDGVIDSAHSPVLIKLLQVWSPDVVLMTTQGRYVAIVVGPLGV